MSSIHPFLTTASSTWNVEVGCVTVRTFVSVAHVKGQHIIINNNNNNNNTHENLIICSS